MMRVVLFVLAVVLVALVGCDYGRTSEEQRREQRQENAERIVAGTYYIEDVRPQPPICYAYYWGGNGYGGPALATVPCESVRHLLVNPSPTTTPPDGARIDRQGL